MLRPSYAELMDIMNEDSKENVTSRYTVVIAASKRARQLIDGDEPMIENPMENKPLSTSVEEIRQGKIKVVPEGEGTVLKPVHVDKDEEDIKKELKEKAAEESAEDINDLDVEDIDDIEDTVEEDLEEIISEE